MENNNKSLFAVDSPEDPAELASALAPQAPAGHFDELRGRTVAKPPLITSQQASPGQSQSQSQGQSPGAGLFLAGTEPPALTASAPKPAQGQQADTPAAPLAQTWTTFFNFLGSDGFHDLSRRTANLQRQIRDNGVTYNVYADADGPQRPWSLDLFPLIISPQDWQQIDTGIRQRARLLNHVMADVYGPQNLLSKGLLPSALVQGHPGYLRAMQGITPAGGTYLHIAAFDLARGPDGRWWVVSQRTQAPSGLGYLLENRLTISLLFPEAFREMKVQRLAATYKALVDGMKSASPASNPRIVLLTPGPYNETYFEHAYLARYLGLTLVEGSDLMVRGEKLYLKTLQGLEPVHGLLKRLDDEFLDPLELRSDSTLGVPGLLQVIRAGNVLVANAPGSAFLESSALLGFLPALSRHLLGETLSIPSLPTWWCGEQAVMQEVLPQLKDCVIKPTYPGSRLQSVIGQSLSRRSLDEWAGRIVRQGEDYTVQAYLPLSQTPTWQGERIAPRSAMLRVFAVADGKGGWQVLPGGLARLAGKNQNIASMQHGGSSADVWVLDDSGSDVTLAGTPARTLREALAPLEAAPKQAETSEELAEPATTLAPEEVLASTFSRYKPPVTSRAAENLFWLGRYTERAENSIRLAQLTLHSLGGEDQSSQPLLQWLTEMAVNNALVLDTVPPATQARRVFERSLIAGLAQTSQPASVGFNLRALKSAASAVRERLSQEQWHIIVRAEADFFTRCEAFNKASQLGAHGLEYSSVEALRTLEHASGFMAAMTGAQTDRMMRDDGWRLLSTGRHIERLSMLSAALIEGFRTEAVFDEGGFGAMIELFDSTITFHAQYQQRRDIPALLDLLVLDRDNPRSLGWVVQTLKGRLAKLAQSTRGELGEVPDLAGHLPDPGSWVLADLVEKPSAEPETSHYERLIQLLDECNDAAFELSDNISRQYFSHAASGNHSLGA
ncbi:MAG: circularly permuted type 2 ATP-grasp protein [Polaromonas sp.]|uniref:circularly permuted type 2 ATP-grasp protein n=1 Tax=Polaromonas sp. TaxID=1869339 RepID=UPI0025CDF9A9|nr:circularly permuted type 2 ATP-grasp protein [Polaromonas sp.]MBI2728539.1 circularly permuted type 2 ATP-grasp protein [Polaromonas sp.]